MATPFLAARPTEESEPIHYDVSEVSDRLQAMRNQEETTYKSINYNNNKIISPDEQECRMMMCQWCYQIVDFCDFQRETVAIAFSILDRYLLLSSEQCDCDRRTYQLASMTSLYIAVKLSETIAINIELMEKLGRSVYTRKEFEEMEMTMITALEWKINRPTPLSFLQCFVALMPASVDPAMVKEIMDCARYQVELAVAEFSLVDRSSSEIAIAAIVNVMMENDLSEEAKTDFIFAVERHTGLNVKSTVHIQSGLIQLMSGKTVSSQMNDTGNDSHTSKRPVSDPESPVSVARRKFA